MSYPWVKNHQVNFVALDPVLSSDCLNSHRLSGQWPAIIMAISFIYIYIYMFSPSCFLYFFLHIKFTVKVECVQAVHSVN